jgi:soluble lytic murein transglycosylase-like protein
MICRWLIIASVFCPACAVWGVTEVAIAERQEAEYYVRAYAEHYRVPLALVRAIVQQESRWHRCAVSPKGAVGLMQIMPKTADALGVKHRCSIHENVSGGVRLLAWLIRRFHGDLRLAVAAYYAGENIVAKRGLRYANPDVVTYVAQVRELYYQNNR